MPSNKKNSKRSMPREDSLPCKCTRCNQEIKWEIVPSTMQAFKLDGSPLESVTMTPALLEAFNRAFAMGK